jgi:ATP-dependent Clp protease, protease subunit
VNKNDDPKESDNDFEVDERILFIHGSIGMTDEDEEDPIRLKDVILKLSKMLKVSKKPVTVLINTSGGLATEVLGIYDAILAVRKKGIRVTTRVEGQGFSGGSVILQAGDVREMTKNSIIMMHDVAGGGPGKRQELTEKLEMMNMMYNLIVDIYTKRTGRTPAEIRRHLEGTKYFTAKAAKKEGLIDRIV